MKFGPVPLDEAVGKLLAHNLVDDRGHRLLGKGRLLTDADIDRIRGLGLERVVVAAPGPNDLDENEAARRVGAAVAGPGIGLVTPGVGRANLIARHHGPVAINVPALTVLNNIDPGITLATLRNHSLAYPGELVTLVKIVPFGISAARVVDVETTARRLAPIVAQQAMHNMDAGLIVSGPERAQARLQRAFVPPTRARLEGLGSRLVAVTPAGHRPEGVAAAIGEQLSAGVQLLLIGSVSAIIDRDDVVPTGLRLAGGTVTHFGMPVDPGSLLMLGYVAEVPVIGAPGCIRSPRTNVIDLLLPRLLAGERLTRADVVALGHGGLLEDISDRPMPRSMTREQNTNDSD